MPEGLVESELFGHEHGAFTGAVAQRLGKVKLAGGGTLFLAEIGDLAPEAQVKLLEERSFERVGGTQSFKADAHIVAADQPGLASIGAGGAFPRGFVF
jgi:transcriptional regulator with GAF, ATPase, and Fis domain